MLSNIFLKIYEMLFYFCLKITQIITIYYYHFRHIFRLVHPPLISARWWKGWSASTTSLPTVWGQSSAPTSSRCTWAPSTSSQTCVRRAATRPVSGAVPLLSNYDGPPAISEMAMMRIARLLLSDQVSICVSYLPVRHLLGDERARANICA